MVEDVSNKTLVALLVVAIFVSLGGTLLSINKLGSMRYVTGAATSDSGTAALELDQEVSVVVEDIINVTGIVLNGSDSFAFGQLNTRESFESTTCDSCSAPGIRFLESATFVSTHLNVTNDGTGTSINVTFNQSGTDATFIDGVAFTPDAVWDSRNDSGNAAGTGCDDVFTNVDGDGAAASICTGLEVGAQFNFFLNATIPDDSTSGLKTETITFYAGVA